MTSQLDVYLHDALAGRLERLANARLRFAYDRRWITEGRPGLSVSLPPREDSFEDDDARPFFAGLLPEGDLRKALARRVGTSEENPFALLDAVGGECAGAVSLVSPGSPPPSLVPREPEWLDDSALATLIDELPDRPLLAAPDEGIRLSLAGAQDKAAVLCESGRVGITAGAPPTSHIMKTPIRRLEATVTNEAFCMRLARDVGLRTAVAERRVVSDREFLLVERYDRRKVGGQIERLHQEDFCQALGIAPEAKYQADGGPSFADCADLVRRVSASPAEDILALVDSLVFNYLIGNHDAHGKNFSLLYGDDGARLAPFYDLISTSVYPRLARKMAMKIGGEYRPHHVRRRHFERMATEAGLGAGPLRRRMGRFADRVVESLEPTRADFEPDETAAPLLATLCDLVRERRELIATALRERA